MNLSLGRIADLLHGEGDLDPNLMVTGYSIDSRTLAAGDLFFAVHGERLDGHDYVEAALLNGAVAAVVSQRWLAPAAVEERRLLRLPDTHSDCVLHGLQSVAREVRRTWGGRVVGITGSAGKTTTKECVAAVLATQFRVLKTEGNLNNHFGLPLQLLRLEPEHEVAVLEMGMNHAGEIRALAAIAEPDWGVVSNVAQVHTEFFADGIEGVARAKRELIEALPPEGIAFLNADDPRVAQFGTVRVGVAADRTVLFGTQEQAQIQGVHVRELGLDGSKLVVQAGAAGEHDLHLQLPGRHNVLNALAAIAVGLAAGVPLPGCCAALAALQPTDKRGAVVEWNGARFINDSYNSNPHALEAMITTLMGSTLGKSGGRRILVAGEMLELGAEGPALHAASGRRAAEAGVDLVLGVRGLARELVDGAKAAGTEAYFFGTPELAGSWLAGQVRAGDLVLLKGSRGVRLERALEQLVTAARASEGTSPQGSERDVGALD